MSKKNRVILIGTILSLTLLWVIAITASAATITIDGIREVAWNSGGSVTDPDEGTISNRYDIETVEWTNDTTNVYLLLDTFGNPTRWDNAAPPEPFMVFCLNVDNNTTTGTTYANCTGAGGYDRYVTIAGGPTLAVTVFQSDFSTVITATTSIANVGNITEISINVGALGLSSTNCGTIPGNVYFDNGTANPDDNVSDAADFNLNCGAPTALTLTNFSARTGERIVVISITGVILLGGALLLIRRRKTPHA
ncbi:MAG: hypothetical protein Fur0022_09470 [Anaerolineales bacterium]